jgi:hypothetical protein
VARQLLLRINNCCPGTCPAPWPCRGTQQNELPGTLNDAYDIRDLMVNHFRFPDTSGKA